MAVDLWWERHIKGCLIEELAVDAVAKLSVAHIGEQHVVRVVDV